MANKKGGLGRGLDALFNENATESESAVNIKLTEIEPNRNQPRKSFDDESLSELASSIEKHGLIQPIVVCPTSSGTYKIIAGERRWRACRMAGLQTVPVVIKECDEQTLAEMALVENLQREDLNAVEEALGYKALIDTYGLTQDKVAQSVSKSRAAVTNTLRLLNLNEEELEALRLNKITAGHARAILSAEDAQIRKECFEMSLGGASVRQVEQHAKQKPLNTVKVTAKKQKNTFYSEVELSLKEELGRRVNIKPTGKGKGTLTLEFYSDKELSEFAKKLTEK
ncbi:MAG: ParB/RepB/Spo0J family partition protein [Clostridia bacterium]|nr:ParB/RepB/Spo0J family partition protein [Clostridia bacterium]